MRISHSHRFVFLSKPKCASTAIRVALDPFSDIRSTQRYPWFHHTSLPPLKQQFNERGWDWDSYFVFTTVRNPYTMLNSLYAYAKPDTSGHTWAERFWDDVVDGRDPPVKLRVPEDPIPFREWILTNDFSGYVLDRFIKDECGRICVNAVLRAEELPTGFVGVTARLGLQPAPTLSMENVQNYVAQPFDDSMCEVVNEVFRTDFEIGGYSLDPPNRATRSARSRHGTKLRRIVPVPSPLGML